MLRLKTVCFGALSTLVLFAAFAGELTGASEAMDPTPGKSYQLRNKQYRELLRPEEANSADGTRIVLYPAQAWKCMTWKFTSAGPSQFSLQNLFTSKTFAAKPTSDQRGASVIQVPFARNQTQRPAWQFVKLKDGRYKIVDSKSGKALSAQRSGTGSDVKIVLEAWQDSDPQKWELEEIDPAKLTM